jgi:hypothetical protein
MAKTAVVMIVVVEEMAAAALVEIVEEVFKNSKNHLF